MKNLTKEINDFCIYFLNSKFYPGNNVQIHMYVCEKRVIIDISIYVQTM